MDFNQSNLFGLANRKVLASMINIDKKKFKNVSLEFIPYKLPNESSQINGKLRDLYNPSHEHKKALRKLVGYFMEVDLPSYVYGGIRKKSHIQNAGIHKDNEYLMLIDIQNFFPSTSDSYVYDLFKNHFSMDKDLAKILTDFVTVPCENREGRYLPQGYPTSPILSFLAYYKMYDELSQLAVKNSLEFSCYYDDLTFSSDTYIAKKLKRKCAKIIEKYRFKIHPTKSLITRKKGIEVTGVFLDSTGLQKAPKKLLAKLQTSYELVRKMDSKPHNYTKIDFVNELNRLQGLIAAVKSIEETRQVELFLNELKYVRKKFNIPYRKSDIKKSFNTSDAAVIQ